MIPAMFAAHIDERKQRPTAPAAVEVAGLVRSFGPKPVLRGVSLTVGRGSCLALLGPNGAGKTTLLRVLATLSKPDAGRARVAGYDVVRDASALRRVVGYVGHQPHLYDELTATENLLFFARMYGLRDGRERVAKLLDRVGLRARASDRVRTLSRGQLQRLSLARGLLHEPSVLLLDEPDTGLDEAAMRLFEEVLAERRQAARTTVLTLHNLERAVALADEIAVLARGRIVSTHASSSLSVSTLRDVFHQYAGGSQ
ncbi:MAG TPA: heme ABC exporter ATP-binding protein CcmA [Ktedonobacterales bacterium]